MNEYLLSNRITKPLNGRRFVIGDIHGCYKTFKFLVKEKIQLTKNDQLFLLGDYINRGPKSKKVLNYIMKLLNKDYQIFPLRGNNEQMLIEMSEQKLDILLWYLKSVRSLDLLIDGKLSDKHVNFLKSLPYFYELDDFYLVHAGFDFTKKNPYKIRKSMLYMRNFKTSLEITKTVIHGHQPNPLDKIINRIEKRKKRLPLDNGVNYTKINRFYDFQKMGNLCCLNLDTYELIVVKNMDIKTDEILA